MNLAGELLDEFLGEIETLCGAKRISAKLIECTDYQKALIDKFLADNPGRFVCDNSEPILHKTMKPQSHVDYYGTRDNFNSKASTSLHYEYLHKLTHKDVELKIILVQRDLTSINSDCILNPICLERITSISSKINLNAGRLYKNELRKHLNEYLTSRQDSKKVSRLF